MGDTNVVSIRASEDGSYEYVREIRGDSVADILSYVEYDPRRILEDLRSTAEQAVRQGRMRYSVNGEFFEIGEGEGLFINSCHMHSFECLRGADCAFSSLLVHPSVLGANAICGKTLSVRFRATMPLPV